MSNDITFCINEQCPVRNICKRGDVPNKLSYWVSKASFVAGPNGCDYILPKP